MKKNTLSKSGAMRAFLFQEETSWHLLHTLETGCCMSAAFPCTELAEQQTLLLLLSPTSPSRPDLHGEIFSAVSNSSSSWKLSGELPTPTSISQ